MPRWYDVRDVDGRVLFRFCPSALAISIHARHEGFKMIDLLEYIKLDEQIEGEFYNHEPGRQARQPHELDDTRT